MGLLFLLATMFMILVLIVVFMALEVLFNNIGFTLLGEKIKQKKYGLVWVPVLGGWYQGTIVSKLIGKGKWLRYFYLLSSLALAVLFIIFLFTDSDYDSNSLVYAFFFAYLGIYAIKRIIHTVAMCRRGFNVVLAILINLFIGPFWAFFMLKRVSPETTYIDDVI